MLKERAALPEEAPDQEILRHNKKREIYQYCESLREDLIKSGLEETEAEKVIEERRSQMLKKFEEGKLDVDLHQTELNDHILDELRRKCREKLAIALKIGKQHQPGSGFDFEAQERKRLEKKIARQEKEVEELKKRQMEELQAIQEVDEESEAVESEAAVKVEAQQVESPKPTPQDSMTEQMPTLIFTEQKLNLSEEFQPQITSKNEEKPIVSTAVETQEVEKKVNESVKNMPKMQQIDRFQHDLVEEPLPKDHSESEDERGRKRSKMRNFDHRKQTPELRKSDYERNPSSQNIPRMTSWHEDSAAKRHSPPEQSRLGRRLELAPPSSDSESSLEDAPLAPNRQPIRKSYEPPHKRSEFGNRKRRH